jgi:5-methylcytosine-specific restriction endonuclease McrA
MSMKKYKAMKKKTRHRDGQWYRGCEQVEAGPKPKRARPKDIKVLDGVPEFYSSAVWQALRLEVKIRDGGMCQYCGKVAQTADHVVPRSHGGADDVSNLVACCHACNKLVGALEFGSFDEKKRWVESRIRPRELTP